MRHTSFLAASLLLSAVACGDDDSKRTTGDLGRLRFEYADTGCFGDCDVHQPIARGAHAVVKVGGDDPSARYRARSSSPHVVVEREDFACMCTESHEGGSTGSSVNVDESCFAPATKHCDRLVSVRGVSEGQTVLEILGPSDEVVDKIVVSVVTPSRVEPVVRAVRLGGGLVRTLVRESDDAFTIDAPVQLIFSATAFDANGRELRTKKGDFRVETKDLSLQDLGEGERAFKFETPAEATLTARGLGLETPFAIHVVGS